MTIDNKLLLVTAITLLYRESTIPNCERSASLVKEVLAKVKLPELQLGIDHERDILSGLKTTAVEMCEAPMGQDYLVPELLQRLKMNAGDDETLYASLANGITMELDEKQAYLSCTQLRRTLQNALKEEGFHRVLNSAGYKYKFERESIGSLADFAAQIVAELEPYTIGYAETKDPAIVGQVNFNNLEAVADVYKEAKTLSEGHGILQTGQQGLNRMLQGGFRPGEAWLQGALQHQYKTGNALDIFHDFCVFNKPYLYDNTKKPLHSFISFENDLRVNFEYLYRLMYELETGEKASLEGKTEEEIAKFVQERLTKNGFEAEMVRVDPTQWSYRDLCSYVIKKEAEGYEVKSLFTDYLQLLPTTGCVQGAMGDDRRDQLRRIRAFTNPRKIVYFTPAQLSTQAKQLVRDGSTDFVRELPGRGYYLNCGTLENEVDGELFGHIEKANGEKYYTVQRGKHRIPTILPEIDSYAVWKFLPVGQLGRDINGPEHTRRKVGGGPIGSSEENPFWAAAEAGGKADSPF